MGIQDVWSKANSLRGCLAGLKTLKSRRRIAIGQDEDPLEVDCFLGDKAKLLLSKQVRVLHKKTQVFTCPKNPLVRTRATHTMETVATAAMIADMLGLNTHLAEAAALGHDIGHVPCGHQGEAWMAKALEKPGFCHEVMGAIKAQKIARKGRGLNLTWDTLAAMVSHGGKTFGWEMSPEAWVVYWADKIAYTFGDISDAKLRICWNLSQEIMGIVGLFGSNHREWASTAISALVVESAEFSRVSFEHSELAQKFKRLRQLMHGVYIRVTEQNVDAILRPVLEFLQRVYDGDPFILLALMTDEDVITLTDTPMKDVQAFQHTSVSEIAPTIQGTGPIDLCDPDLNW